MLVKIHSIEYRHEFKSIHAHILHSLLAQMLLYIFANLPPPHLQKCTLLFLKIFLLLLLLGNHLSDLSPLQSCQALGCFI